MRCRCVYLLCAGLSTACMPALPFAPSSTDDDDDSGSPVTDAGAPPDAAPVVIVDLVVDSNRNGTLDPGDPTEEAGEDAFTAEHGAVFLANLDDDDGAGVDATDSIVNGDDDVADLAPVLVRAWPEAPATVAGVLSMSTNVTGKVHLFRVDGPPERADSYKLVADTAAVPVSADELRAGQRFAVEAVEPVLSRGAGAWDGTVHFTLTVNQGDAGVLGTDQVLLRVAPLVFQHNLAATETVFYSDMEADSDLLAAGLTQFSQGAAFSTQALNLDDRRLDWDQWTQDFFDVAWMTRPGPGGVPVGMKVGIKSAQPDRKAGNVVSVRLQGPGWGVLSVVSRNPDLYSHGYSMSSFGNWDVIPPYTKGELSFPLGRNYWGQGTTAEEQPDPVYAEMVRAQGVQPELTLDTSWLTVGHVDEFTAPVRANSARGWALLTGDAAGARQMLQDLLDGGHGDARLFMGKSWWDDNYNETSATVTVQQVLADPDLMAANQSAQVSMDTEISALKAEIGLADAEVIPLPFLFHELYGAMVAYQPDPVNLLHADGRVLVAKPFGPDINGVDPFEQDARSRLEALGLTVFFVDDWDLLHAMDGEVHCGTNVARKMDAPWWTTGR